MNAILAGGCGGDVTSDETTPADSSQGGARAMTGGSATTTPAGGTSGGYAPLGGGGVSTPSGGTRATGGIASGGYQTAGGSGPIGLPVGGASVPYYASGDYRGGVWYVADPGGSTILAYAADLFCATGVAAQVPLVDGGYDYAATWGVLLGWNLNEPLLPDGGMGPFLPADLSGKSSITVGLMGAAALTLRVQLSVSTEDGGNEQYFCAVISTSTTPTVSATIPLASLRTECWGTTGIAFDPTTMQPSTLGIQIVTNTTTSYGYRLCITALSIQ